MRGSAELSSQLDHIELLLFENPQNALPVARQTAEDHPESARAWATVGVGSLRCGELKKAEAAFERAANLPADPFDRAQIMSWHSLFFAEFGRWKEALERVDEALVIHQHEDLRGPPDRGLPSILAIKGVLLRQASSAGDPLGDLLEAGTLYRRVLKMLDDDPLSSAPRTFLSATLGTGMVALQSGHLTKANAALKDAVLKVPDKWLTRTVAGAKIEWLEAVVGAEIFGFAEQWQRELERAEKTLCNVGALRDSVLAGFDHILYLLQERSIPWSAVEARLTLYRDLFRNDELSMDVRAALSHFLSCVHERRLYIDDLRYVYTTVGRTLRSPEERHARKETEEDLEAHLKSMMDHGMNVIEDRFPDLTWSRLSRHMNEYMLSKKARMERASKKKARALKKA